MIRSNKLCRRISSTCVVIILVIGLGFIDAPVIVVLIPQAPQSLVLTSVVNIVGLCDTLLVNEIQLIERYQTKKYLPAASGEQKEQFPKEVKALFPLNFLLERTIVRSYRFQGGADSVSYGFRYDDNVDLKTFWASKTFREILAIAYDKKVSAVEITLMGGRTRTLRIEERSYLKRFGNTFAFPIELTPGTNMFYLRAFGAGERILQFDSLSFFYKTSVQRENPPVEFTHRSFHADSIESQCSSCHTLTLSDSVKQEKSAVEAECSPCHAALENQRSIHPPAATWDCLMCHDPISSPKYQLYVDKKYDASLCYECHTDKKELIASKRVVHAPTGAGECLTCHDPHGTPNDALVVNKVNNVCGACHEEVLKTPHPVARHPLGGRPDPRDPTKELVCASCHNPHGSDNNTLLIAPRIKLCQQCHKK